MLLMLDTDLGLQPDVIALLAAAHAEHPGKILWARTMRTSAQTS
jgi:hypothetical protein